MSGGGTRRGASGRGPAAGGDAVARGLTLERAGRTDEAMAAYGFATHSAVAQSRLAHLLLSQGRKAEALAAFRAAAALDAGSAGRMDEVRALMLEDRDAEAEPILRVVLAAEPAHFDARWMLGRVLSQTGRFEAAEAELAQAVAVDPRQGSAWYDLVRSRRMTEADRPRVAKMIAALPRVKIADERAKLCFALGKTLDDLGDYAGAMRWFGQANAVKARVARLDRTRLTKAVDALIAAYPADVVAANAAKGDPSARPVFVLGMPRSGTTLVEQILSSHREVAGAGELTFWNTRDPLARGIGGGMGATQRATAEACLARLAAVDARAARVVDKNPFNFFWAGLIHVVFPNAVMFHCRRAAIDTCLSIHSTYFVPRTDFSTEAEDLVFYWGQYARLTDHWRAVLPADRWIDVDYAALVADPEPRSRALVAALGLPWDAACLAPERNERTVRTSSQWQVRQPINAAGLDRWRRYEPWLGALKALAPVPGSRG